MDTSRRGRARLRRLAVSGLAVVLVGFGALGGAGRAVADTKPISTTLPPTVSADPLPTWQLNGVVWSQVVVGTTVYATGAFTTARPPGVAAGGAGEITVGNLFAYDITTGNRVTTFNHSLNAAGQTVTASPDGSRIYVGGDFTAVDGQTRQHVAAFDTATGALVTSFAPTLNAQVKALVATGSTLYVGGAFSTANGVARKNLAAVTTATGALTGWAPTADDGYVWSLVVTPDQSKVVVGGQFSTINGAAVYGMGAVSATTGVSQPWAANSTIKDYDNGAIDSLTTDGTLVYGSGWAFGTGGSFEGAFALNPADGSIRWLEDCQGDTYDVQPVGPVVYTVSHSHNCTMVGAFGDTSPRTRWQRAGAWTTAATGTNNGPDVYGWNYKGVPAPTMLHWYPTLTTGTASGQSQAAWSVTSGSGYVALGGEFPSVNGTAQQGLTRFALPGTATGTPPNKVGPQYLDTIPVRSTAPATTVARPSTGTIRVTYGAAWDRDNQRLTYQVYRDRGATAEKLLTTRTFDSSFWAAPDNLTYDDVSVPTGTHTYQVVVTDPFGNTLLSPVSNGIDGYGNQPPAAAVAVTSTSGLTAAVSGSGSTDPDGTVTSYRWSWGDGTTSAASAATTASHGYASGGTYPVTLTATDNNGATATATTSVTVATAPPTTGVLASDAFRRTTGSGWGTADVGGAWALSGVSTLFSVGNGAGRMTLNAASGPSVRLPVSSTGTSLTFSYSLDKAPSGGGQYVRAIGRGTSSNGYQARVVVTPTATTLALTKVVAGTETVIASAPVSPAFVAGATYQIRVEVVGTGTTTLRARVWRSDTTEPTTWAVTGTDTTAALQVAGGVGAGGYLSGSATTAPVTLRISGLSAAGISN